MARLAINSTVKLPSGYAMPVLGFGVYKTPVDVVTKVCKEALDIGYRHIDSASGYFNQGPSAASISQTSVPRSSVFFTTKIPPSFKQGLNYDIATDTVNAALTETQLDYLDLVLIHAPFGGSANRKGAWRALVDAVDAGKVRSIGVSNYGVHHLEELEAYIKELEAERGQGKGGIISVGQWELHPWLTRPDIVSWCRARDIVVEAYCPIVRGQRFGKEPKVAALADKYGKTEAQVLLRWSLQRGYVPLVKTVTSSRIRENAEVFDFELTEEEVEDLRTDEYSVCSWDPTVKTLEE